MSKKQKHKKEEVNIEELKQSVDKLNNDVIQLRDNISVLEKYRYKHTEDVCELEDKIKDNHESVIIVEIAIAIIVVVLAIIVMVLI